MITKTKKMFLIDKHPILPFPVTIINIALLYIETLSVYVKKN